MAEILNSQYPVLKRLLDAQLSVAPNQEKFFRRRFSGITPSDLEAVEEFAGHVAKLIGQELTVHVEDYAWLCEEQINEELYFRRHGKYRLSSFEEAFRTVYSNKDYMTRYMNGLLMTQLWWSNHQQVFSFYRDKFLGTNPPGYSHLEIGSGHGLFLYFAAADPNAGSVTAWDISETSIEATAKGLKSLGLAELPKLELRNLFERPGGAFDSLVFSEVLEHMEDPIEALKALRTLLSDNGRMFLNMPINSPAPDHLFNADSPEALENFVTEAGFDIVDSAFFPATNKTMEEAVKKKLTISCVFVAKRR